MYNAAPLLSVAHFIWSRVVFQHILFGECLSQPHHMNERWEYKYEAQVGPGTWAGWFLLWEEQAPYLAEYEHTVQGWVPAAPSARWLSRKTEQVVGAIQVSVRGWKSLLPVSTRRNINSLILKNTVNMKLLDGVFAAKVALEIIIIKKKIEKRREKGFFQCVGNRLPSRHSVNSLGSEQDSLLPCG